MEPDKIWDDKIMRRLRRESNKKKERYDIRRKRTKYLEEEDDGDSSWDSE
jgi:hypothetical protein